MVCFIYSCNYLNNRYHQINQRYKAEVLDVYDHKYIEHFPSKIEYLPIGYRTRDTDIDMEQAAFLSVTYPTEVLNTIYNKLKNNSVAHYNANQNNLLIVNRFTNETNWDERKNLVLQDTLKFYTEVVDYTGKFPVPNFWDDSENFGNTECNLAKDFELLILEAKAGKFLPDSCLVSGEYMPNNWKHGITRGVAISKERRKVIYWYVNW